MTTDIARVSLEPLPETMRTFRAFRLGLGNDHAKFAARCVREHRDPAVHVFIATSDPRDAYVIVNYTRGMVTRSSRKLWNDSEARRIRRRPAYRIEC
jgi:hypothetical protein